MFSSLDKEWVNLMLMARELGVTKEQVKEFINKQKNDKDLAEAK